MGKSTISMAIFNSYFDITRGYQPFQTHPFLCGWTSSIIQLQSRVLIYIRMSQEAILFNSKKQGLVNVPCWGFWTSLKQVSVGDYISFLFGWCETLGHLQSPDKDDNTMMCVFRWVVYVQVAGTSIGVEHQAQWWVDEDIWPTGFVKIVGGRKWESKENGRWMRGSVQCNWPSSGHQIFSRIFGKVLYKLSCRMLWTQECPIHLSIPHFTLREVLCSYALEENGVYGCAYHIRGIDKTVLHILQPEYRSPGSTGP